MISQRVYLAALEGFHWKPIAAGHYVIRNWKSLYQELTFENHETFRALFPDSKAREILAGKLSIGG